jgi:hypothetical protein
MPGEFLHSAVNAAGHYIGDEDTAKFLCDQRGITPELAQPDNNVCSIGFCEAEQKWYGWSHRAIYGFGIGSKVEKGDCGYVPVGWDDFLDGAARFWQGDGHLHVTATRGVDEGGRDCAHVAWEYTDDIPNKKLRGKISGSVMYPPAEWGKGEWTAATLDDGQGAYAGNAQREGSPVRLDA